MDNNKKYDCLRLSNQLCFPLYAASRRVIGRYRAMLDALGLTYTQYVVMMVMWEKEKISSRDLADSTHLDYGTLTPVLKRLEQAGYLKRERMPEDERLLLLTLTKEGKALKDKAVNIPTCIASCMGLTAEEFRTLYEITYKALGNMENMEIR